MTPRDRRGPSVVALGGGHGLAVTLSAVSRYAGRVTAVVSAADDGGSSGRLREWWDGPAPGDIRRCLLALAGDSPQEKLWAAALEHRFPAGSAGLEGHSLGNLVLVGLSEILGDFVAAIAEAARLLGVSATILPATTEAVELHAEQDGGGEIRGQANIARSPDPLRRIWLTPSSPAAPAEVVRAIAEADQVVLGPGSLFTSVLAVCAVPDVRVALEARSGGRVYVCNLSPQSGETGGYGAEEHLAALAAHHVHVDAVVCDPASAVGAPSQLEATSRAGTAGPGTAGARTAGARTAGAGTAGPGTAGPGTAGGGLPAQIVTASVSAPGGHAHDPALLAEILQRLSEARG